MKALIFISSIILLIGSGTVNAEVASLPVKLSQAQIDGAIFSDKQSVVTQNKSEKGAFTTEDVEMFLSSNKHFDAGMYRSGTNRFTITGPYGVDEFMYFLRGVVTLTSANGDVIEINAGDAVMIPKEWTGIWETNGYTKIYVIYSADKPIE